MAETRAERTVAFTKLIQDTVASDTWKDNGGSVGSVRELSGQLIVTQAFVGWLRSMARAS